MGNEVEEVEAEELKSPDDIMKMAEIPKDYKFNINGGSNEFEIEKGRIQSDPFGSAGVICGLETLPQGMQSRLRGKGFKRLVVCNADGDGNQLIDDMSTSAETSAPSLSFICLANLMDTKNSEGDVETAYGAVLKGTVVLLDFLPDEKIPAKLGKISPKAKKKVKPPKPGFTLVGSNWHRAATVLLANKKNGVHYMMGQDDNQYFGVQLKGTPKTIDEAFADLTPEEARVVGAQRQGEWFAVPVDEEKLPLPAGDIESMVLHKADPHSNDHALSAEEIRIHNGVVYAKEATLSHDEHGDMSCDGWVKFLQNTAVRSVSVSGVD